MHHSSGDNAIGVTTGLALSFTGNVAGWVSSSSFLVQAMETVALGLLGGAAGFLGKKAIEWAFRKRKRR